MRILCGAGCAVLISTLMGCAALSSVNSISDSSGSASSLSESVSDSGSSLSNSSSAAGRQAALERDVRTYTALFSDSGADVEAYLRGVGALCEAYSVSRWEAEPAVTRAMALGLADSRLSVEQIERFADVVSAGDPDLRETLRTAAAAR